MTSGPTWDFFLDLDRQLPAQRGPRGELSRTDFQTHDLLLIIDRFATGWDHLPQLIPVRDDYRALISAASWSTPWPSKRSWRPTASSSSSSLSIDTTWTDDDQASEP